MKALAFFLKLWYAFAMLVAVLICWTLMPFLYLFGAIAWFFDSNNKFKP